MIYSRVSYDFDSRVRRLLSSLFTALICAHSLNINFPAMMMKTTIKIAITTAVDILGLSFDRDDS